jgi:hypothetical protein
VVAKARVSGAFPVLFRLANNIEGIKLMRRLAGREALSAAAAYASAAARSAASASFIASSLCSRASAIRCLASSVVGFYDP